MSLIVQKFGGSSVKDAERIKNVARIIAETYLKGNDVIVVLSAQGDTTDDLIAKAGEINPHASKREMDMLLSTGEQISVARCAMALEVRGLPVVSLAAWMTLSIGFSFYVENLSSYSVIYGTLGAVIVLMIWLYLTATILIMGAELNAALRTARTGGAEEV